MDNRGLPPQTSNFYCLPGRAGGTPMGISESHLEPYTAKPRKTLGSRIACSCFAVRSSSLILYHETEFLVFRRIFTKHHPPEW
jgi:hypothetical protein